MDNYFFNLPKYEENYLKSKYENAEEMYSENAAKNVLYIFED